MNQKTNPVRIKIKVIVLLMVVFVLCSGWGFFSHRM